MAEPNQKLSAEAEALARAEKAEREQMFQCRFYENEYPEVDSLVMVEVVQIAEMGAYVKLLEYNDKEGMIQFSELSRRRIRSIPKLIRVGKRETVVVVRVDKEKGYIDLSKKRADRDAVAKFEDDFSKSKVVQNVLHSVAHARNMPMVELARLISWPLYKSHGHAFFGLKAAIDDPDGVLGPLGLDAEVREALLSSIHRRMAPQAVRVRADIEVMCYAYSGVEGIKRALHAGKACETEDIPLSIQLIAPPLFVVLTQSLNRAKAIQVMKTAIEKIGEVITAEGGTMNVKMEPRATTQDDESQLEDLKSKLSKENQEVDGDDEAE